MLIRRSFEDARPQNTGMGDQSWYHANIGCTFEPLGPSAEGHKDGVKRVGVTANQGVYCTADVAIERGYEYYFWGHADVAVLAKDESASFADDVVACVESSFKSRPKWGVIYFHYDWFSAIRTDLMRQVCNHLSTWHVATTDHFCTECSEAEQHLPAYTHSRWALVQAVDSSMAKCIRLTGTAKHQSCFAQAADGKNNPFGLPVCR